MRRHFTRNVAAVCVTLGLATYVLFGVGPSAQARLSSKDWKAAEKKFHECFGARGNAPARVETMKVIASDASSRAWRLMAEGLHLETQLCSQIQADITKASAEHGEFLTRSTKGYTDEDYPRVQALQKRLTELESESAAEREALGAILELISQGPKALRKAVLKRAKPDSAWPYRAAAAQIAARSLSEKTSSTHLKKLYAKELDPRVRLASLDALALVSDGWEGPVLERLTDPDESIVLAAARILQKRGLKQAAPQLVRAMDGASPRVVRGLREAVLATDPEAEAWHAWQAKHKGGITSARVCGVPLDSDRVLFLLDISAGIAKAPKDEPSDQHWKPTPPTKGGKSPRATRLSGPGIDIAKHELRVAITALPASATFNIIAFNQASIAWERTPATATERNKESAYRWIRGLKPRGVSYVDGALRMGFRMAGMLDFGPEAAEIAADTIVLLTIGSTTDNGLPVAAPMDPESILANVRGWNRRGRVVIHGIALKPSEYVKKLAAQNGGVYVE